MPTGELALGRPPAVPYILEVAVRDWNGINFARNLAPAPWVNAALQSLPLLAVYLAPAKPAAIKLWLNRLRGGTGPMVESEYRERVPAIITASGDLPAFVWRDETLAAALREFRFFPETAVLDAMLRPPVRDLLRQLSAIRRLAAATALPPPEQFVPVDPELLVNLARSMVTTLPPAPVPPVTKARGVGLNGGEEYTIIPQAAGFVSIADQARANLKNEQANK